MRIFLIFVFAISFLGCKSKQPGNADALLENNLPAETVSEDSAMPFDFFLPESEGAEIAIYKEEQQLEMRNIVGFHCFAAGIEPQTVEEFRILLEQKKYNVIRHKLFSLLPAEQYLATVVCERLFKRRIIESTTQEAVRIATIRKSEETLATCSGCMVLSGVTLKELFRAEYEYLYSETEKWIEEIVD